MNIREKIADYAYAFDGEWIAISKAIIENKTVPHIETHENYITVCDEAYPDCLRRLRYPPWILFYEGNISLLKMPMITIVGSREMTDYGKRMTELTAVVVRRKFVTVSGLAKGVDACVHQKTMEFGHTIGVIGSGLGTHYPRCNEFLYRKMKDDDLILSEYPYATGVQKYHFPWRNRILAAMGEACIVTQAQMKSGTMLTVNEALTLGKEIYAFPYPMDDENGAGCNKLIADGANIVYDALQLEEIQVHHTNS